MSSAQIRTSRMRCVAALALFVSSLALAAEADNSEEKKAQDALAASRTAQTGISKGSFNPEKRGIVLPKSPKVMVVPVNDKESTKYGMIDEWQANFIKRRLQRAEDEKFDLVILEINTHGGSVDACDQINKAIAECKVPVIAYVDGMAFSGGALISLGSKAIIMAPGSQIGGAKVVTLFGDLPEGMRQKADSMIAASVKNLCEANNYPLPIGLGMVNSDVEVLETNDPAHRFMTDAMLNEQKVKPDVTHKWKSKNQILTLTSSEAVNVGLASGVASDLDEIYQGLGVTPATVERADVTAAESLARFLSNPIWSVLLVIIGLVALIWEMKSPGHGVGYIAFAFCLGFFFWLQVFAANAGLFEILLFGAGAALIAVEVFILPTFGIGLFIGFGMVLVSIILAFVPENLSLWNLMRGRGSEQDMQRLADALKWATLTVIAIAAAAITGLIKGAKLPGLSRLALQTENAGAVHDSASSELAFSDSGRKLFSLIGQNATTETVLRPAGKIRLDGVTYDAVSEGAFIDPGAKVVVLRVSSGNLVVRAV